MYFYKYTSLLTGGSLTHKTLASARTGTNLFGFISKTITDSNIKLQGCIDLISNFPMLKFKSDR